MTRAAVGKKFRIHFEWDPRKATENLRKHGVSFEQAGTIFHDPLILTQRDEGHSDQEDRWLSIGENHEGILLVLAHNLDEEGRAEIKIRLISARKATRRERRQYEELE